MKAKPSNMRKIVAGSILLTRVNNYFFQDFIPGDVKLPCELCSRFNLILLKIDQRHQPLKIKASEAVHR